MHTLAGSTVAFRIPPWVAGLPAWAMQVAWMALGGLAGATVAALVDDALAEAQVASPSPFTAGLLLPLLGLGMLAGSLLPSLRATPLFALSAGSLSTLGLGLGAPIGSLLGLCVLLPPLMAVLLRREPAVQAAATAFLAVGVVSFQAAAGLRFLDNPAVVLLAALAAMPAVLALRGAWRGLAVAGGSLAALVGT